MRSRRPLVAGNWKMNSSLSHAKELAAGLARSLPEELPGVEVAACPPFPYLTTVAAAIAGSGIKLGAQNCSHRPPGAFTGEVAAEMLVDVGCQYVILGHSERRTMYQETDAVVNSKLLAAVSKGLTAILCVGELIEERQANRTEAVLETQMSGSLSSVSGEQMKRVVIAYEPVWAIGTGLVATPDQAESAHTFLRQWVANRYNPQIANELRILYGGGVKPETANSLLGLPNVDGALVGGASLKLDQFWPICTAAAEVGVA